MKNNGASLLARLGQRLGIIALIFASLFSPIAVSASDTSASVQLKLLRTIKAPYVINRLAWHPDNRQLATAQNLNKKVTIWDVSTGKVIRSIESEAGGVGALAYSPDGKYLAVGRIATRHTPDHAHIHLYNANTGELARRFVPPAAAKGDANDADALDFSPDSRYLATKGYGGMGAGVVYDLDAGKVIAKLSDATGILHSLAFSPDGKYLAVGRSDRAGSRTDQWGRQVFNIVGRIELWASDSWKVARSITIPSPNIIYFTVPAVTFSSDSKQLASTIAPAFGGARDDRTGQWVTPEPTDRIKLWNVSTTDQINSFASSHIGSIRAIRFSADGKLLLTGGGDKIIEIWSTRSGTKLRTLGGFAQVAHFSLNRVDTLLATASGEEIKLWELIR